MGNVKSTIDNAIIEIREETKFGTSVQHLLEEHMSDMRAISPPESVHALDINALKQPNITFWTIWQGDNIIGCGALKRIDRDHGESEYRYS